MVVVRLEGRFAADRVLDRRADDDALRVARVAESRHVAEIGVVGERGAGGERVVTAGGAVRVDWLTLAMA